ncbi:hypothetical protein BW737_004810 [Actinomyces ruminis]|uniref:Uncharacterized protein n=1 Tax=Actinomyces ruminis TaxID=1937003 RepID=A0ABX4MCE6_9ACTO|nr:hypothetical protein BW737_004810 [Actinomyces ruminis]
MAIVMAVLFAGMVGLWFAPATGPAGLLHALWFTSGCTFWFLAFLLVTVAAARRRRALGGQRRAPVIAGFAVFGTIILALGLVTVWSSSLLAVDLVRGTSTVEAARCIRIDYGSRSNFDDAVLALPDGTTASSELSFAFKTDADRELRALCGTDATFTMEYWPATATVRRVAAE